MADERLRQFEEAIEPHLGAAYNVAPWLTRNAHDAEDIVQEAFLCAYQFFDSFHGGDGRAWMLRIIRNTCHTWLRTNRPRQPLASFDEAWHTAPTHADRPNAPLQASEDRELLRQALAQLPEPYREVIVLQELEEMS